MRCLKKLVFERERTGRHVAEVAILLYDCGVSLRRVSQVLGWTGVERSHVAVWTWIQKFGRRLGEAGRRPAANLLPVCLPDEIAISQPAMSSCCSQRLIQGRRSVRVQLSTRATNHRASSAD
jgi:transposase-like protein